MYRYRTASYLLEPYREIERQEIFFPRLDQLNDPMEDRPNFVWIGDGVVWKNLLRHYLYCLVQACYHVVRPTSMPGIELKSIPIFGIPPQFGSLAERRLYEKSCATFFTERPIAEYLERITSRAALIRRDDLISHLWIIHWHALNVIFFAFEECEIIIRRPSEHFTYRLCLPDINKVISVSKLEGNDGQDEIEDNSNNAESPFFDIFSGDDIVVEAQGFLSTDQTVNEFIFRDYPKDYVRLLARLVHPDLYVTCFSTRCDDNLMWSHYGDGYRGACLIFRADLIEGRPFITFRNQVVGWGSKGKIYGDVGHEFIKVNYTNNRPEIDFFRSLGRLPYGSIAWWYLDEMGNRSSLLDELDRDRNQWVTNYQTGCMTRISTKTQSWASEEEYRLIIGMGLSDFADPNDRKMKYDFGSLDGIIFGSRMPRSQMTEIRAVIGRKCNESGRSGFVFYQASPAESDKVVVSKIGHI